MIYGIHTNFKFNFLFSAGMASGSLSKCQYPPPVMTQARRTITPDNPDTAEVITEVNIKTHLTYPLVKFTNLLYYNQFPFSLRFQCREI